MARKASDRVPFRRRREGKTDFRYRLRLLKSGVPRAVVRKTNTKTIVQFIQYDPAGDKVVAQATSKDLEKFGWKGSCSNITSAYLTGLLAATRAKGSKIDSAVLDIGLNEPIRGSRMFASLKGIIDAGVEVPHGEDIIPEEDYILKDTDKGEFDKVSKKIKEA